MVRGMEVRQLEPDEADVLLAIWEGLSSQSRYHRFLAPVQRPDQIHPERLLDVDHGRREALTAWVADRPVGVARYADQDGDTADFAVAVVDAWQRRGVGSALLEALAKKARDRGFLHLHGIALGENRAVVGLLLAVFGGHFRGRFVDGSIEIDVDLDGRTNLTTDAPAAARPAPRDRHLRRRAGVC